MRIAVVVCVYPPYRGGIGQAAHRQAALIQELGHEVHLLAPAGPSARPGVEIVNGVRVERLRPLLSYGNSALLPQLAARAGRYDALYLHYPFYGGAEAAALGALVRRVPYVVFFHMDVLGSGARGALLDLYGRAVEPWVLRGGRVVMASSEDYFRHSRAARHIDQVTPVAFGIDTVRYSPGEVPAADLDRLGLPAGVPIVLFVGGMDAPHAFKGVPELLRAFSSAGVKERAHLALVGDGELRAGFERRAAELGLASSATFLGRVPEADLILAYRAAAVTVLPSTTREEAFGLVLIEAMACGSPVIATRLPGVRDVVGEGDGAGGLLVPAGDVAALAAALERGIDDGPGRKALAAAALGRARGRYSREAERAALERVLTAELGAGEDEYPRGRLSATRRGAALMRAARVTATPAAFVRRELAARLPRRGVEAGTRVTVGSYRLPEFDCEVDLRHGTLDVPLFHDIMVAHDYQPPLEVLAAESGREPLRVVNLGANIGLFAAFLASRVRVASLVAYEPDRTSLDLLRRNLGRCRRLPEWRIVEACAGAANGEVAFLDGQFRESRVMQDAGAQNATRLPLVNVFPDLQDADWLKIDIEGSEWEIIADPRLRDVPVRTVALEYHAWRCPGPDPRALATEALADAGFQVSDVREHIPGYGELWAWRPTPG